MKQIYLLFIIITALSFNINAQTKPTKAERKLVMEERVVRDSSGMLYPYVVWNKMVSSGDYKLKAINPKSDSTTYLIYKLTDKQKDKIYAREPMPSESKFFRNGEKISSFSATDIDGNKIKLKDLAGKVVVLNFWFIGCEPCRKEMPELDKLAIKYASDPNVIFVAIAPDNANAIRKFLRKNPFSYHMIDDGRIYSDLYRINEFPTNIVLDKEGKVLFNSTGFSLKTPYWINKAIEQVEQGGL